MSREWVPPPYSNFASQFEHSTHKRINSRRAQSQHIPLAISAPGLRGQLHFSPFHIAQIGTIKINGMLRDVDPRTNIKSKFTYLGYSRCVFLFKIAGF